MEKKLINAEVLSVVVNKVEQWCKQNGGTLAEILNSQVFNEVVSHLEMLLSDRPESEGSDEKVLSASARLVIFIVVEAVSSNTEAQKLLNNDEQALLKNYLHCPEIINIGL